MDGQPRAYIHVAAAAEYSSSREIDVMGDGSQVPFKSTRQSTARICHTRMVLPAAAGRGNVVTL